MEKDRLKHSELTFQLMIESVPNAIVLVNKEGKIAYINTQTEKLFGYDRTELIGQTIEQLIPQRYRKNHPGFRNMFFASPSVRAMGAGRELYAIRKDGSEFPVEIGLNPLVTADGTLVLASVIDITERKKAEDRFRLVVESAPSAMILVNKKGVITLVNAQTVSLFGYQREELVGNKLEMLIPKRFMKNHPGYRDMFFGAPTTRAMGGGRDLYALRKDGSEIQVEIGLNPIETDEGQSVLASVIDITKRKEHEKIIKKQVNQLEIKNKELQQFAYIASHDLQEPLRTISNYIQIIEEDYEEQLAKGVTTHLKTINRATNRMQTLVMGLLSFSRLGRDRELATVDCKKIVRQVVADLNNLIITTGATVKIGDLPTLNAYEAELRQLFQNLISNGIKFNKKGQFPEVNIGQEERNGQLLFFVSDNGIGIAPRDFKRIFNIFQRLHTDGKYEGNGIGLANCKKIVELHGGRIWVESEIGKGAKFCFTLSKSVEA